MLLSSICTPDTFKRLALASGIVVLSLSQLAQAASEVVNPEPGAGRVVRPIDFGNINTQFQTEIVRIGLEKLGYEVKTALEADPTIAHLSVGQEDADYMAVHWNPLHEDYYERSGGDEINARVGVLVKDALQGILIDKKTADAHAITDLSQLKDPEIAKLFDIDGDGKADLTGCNPGWGCEKIIEDHLDNLGLRETVTHRQGVYGALIADTIAHYGKGNPVLYYTWTPMWVSNILVPGEDSHWLNIRYPGTGESTGIDLGFTPNTVQVMANRTFLSENPAAKTFFENVSIDIQDVNAENALVEAGEDKPRDIERHAQDWISRNQAAFDQWLAQARQAASGQ
ncbi:glycine betaine/L-proline ABC transporter substrate-binding protein ProX [Marinobacterium rhizophilum]|uniref:Glycine betaine/L-proline ABC transporter substrate-binding protein ProX n=1 Tax=Marinobacterium rhizophilum TaxID=420402 RepID=A0ABY5HE02_9GAMM|nr:glycine betaine/L-proline ABC transporter substrate-binding protein ProX [Marinobacterium rhizophilum]UTW10091.1 glycine betaine/L-proline ABC transporter substrate-binding protein ProX [Marinobacterium rhizophilum]